jgi:PAS domain S-box-containing protein
MKKVPSKIRNTCITGEGNKPEDLKISASEKTKNQQDLRKDAEMRLSERSSVLPEESGCSPDQIVHELRVHQIELEMQNEALRESQQALEESRDRYADLYDFAPVGYLTLTDKGVISEANLTAATILGIERNKLIKRLFRTYISRDDREQWSRYFTRVLKTTDRQIGDLKLRKGDGSVINVRLESIRMGNTGTGKIIRTAISDVTELVTAEEKLALKSRDLDELSDAYQTIAEGKEDLRRNMQELTDRESQLREALAEKEVLLSEIHHRVKNNLTAFIALLGLEGSYDNSPAGMAFRKDLQNRARSMALIHETLYKTKKYAEVDMNIYLTTLVEQIVASYKPRKTLKIILDAREISLDLGRGPPIGLIVNELVTNSLKYAFPGGCKSDRSDGVEPCTIRIALSKDSGMYTLSVSDNGVGLSPDFNIRTTQTLGLKLVNFLAKHQLGAEPEINTEKGTEIFFRFKE